MSETVLAVPVTERFNFIQLDGAEFDAMMPIAEDSATFTADGKQQYRSNTPPLDAAAALAASFGLGFDFGIPTIERPEVDAKVHEPPVAWGKVDLEALREQFSESPSQSRSPEEVVEVSQHLDGSDQPPVDAAAALAASFGFGIDVVKELSRDVGSKRTDEEPSRFTEIVEPGSKSPKAATRTEPERPRKKFKKRTGTTRERTGCLTCRQRRKKCDDNTYPICGHCRRLNLECVREAPRPLQISVGSSSQSGTSDHGRATAVVSHTPANQPHPLSLGHRRNSSSYGDLSGIAMGGVDFRITIPEGLAMPMWDDETGGDRRYLMKYYTQVLASLVTTNHENNSFLSVFLPMAIDSPPLLSALTAWSCAHLSCFHAPYQTPLLNRRGQALRAVAQSLSVPTQSLAYQETLLAATLVLCSLEIIHGDTSCHWLRHLEGAAVIIGNSRSSGWDGLRTGPDALRGTSDGEWLLRNFAYHDVLGSVTLGKPPLIRGTYWLSEDKKNGIIDTYMGVGCKILGFISDTSCLEIPAVDAWDSLELRKAFEDRADELESSLLAWTAPMVAQPGLVSLAESWRSAALIHLYRKKRAYYHAITPTSPQLANIAKLLTRTASAALNHLGDIPPNTLPESGMLFPIFMAAGETRNATEMAAVRERMKELGRFRGFVNIKKALDVLEELWRCWGTGVKAGAGAQEREVQWEDVCERRGWVLMLA